MPERVAGVVLAAGEGRRFGMPKALVRYHGSLLVERAVSVLRAAGCEPVLVVLGAAAERITETAELAGSVPVTNPDWRGGMGSSLRTGLTTLRDSERSSDVTSALILPVDMPGITEIAVRRVSEYAAPDALAAASYHGERGHPVLLGRLHWDGVRDAARGDRGARDYLRAREVVLVACEDVSEAFDIDSPEDLNGG
ncbi:nucleotidyltransferase family protein [Actinopolyspora mzabensis]|uniref:nucleotidyltransferase family protein n=1 Tax=Actinopolyspora mzabensis TaxID=995066 RepID=UPI000B8292E9|nr:nucleotidyltransferase family protein [Actinopolyspora mzabensis]